MKPLREAVEDYIALRRSLGFKLCRTAAGLRDFVAFLERKAASYITTELAMEWATQPTHHQPSDWAQRLGFVRVFARYWSPIDRRTEVPPAGLLPFRPKRARPYLYSEEEIQKLLAAALKLSPGQGLRPWTYHCLLGLLAVLLAATAIVSGTAGGENDAETDRSGAACKPGMAERLVLAHGIYS